jgi:acid phosphatase family membrane protein YuiD
MVAVDGFKSLFDNIILLSTAASWCIAQIIKMFIILLTRKQTKIWKVLVTAFWSTGGMPSSHSTVVCCLTSSVALKEGLNSTLFAVAAFFALVVLRDSLGIRRAAGIQARVLNDLGKRIAEKTESDFKPVEEIEGHSPLEVITGVILGIIIAISFFLLCRF